MVILTDAANESIDNEMPLPSIAEESGSSSSSDESSLELQEVSTQEQHALKQEWYKVHLRAQCAGCEACEAASKMPWAAKCQDEVIEEQKQEVLKTWYRAHLQAQCAGCEVCHAASSQPWAHAIVKEVFGDEVDPGNGAAVHPAGAAQVVPAGGGAGDLSGGATKDPTGVGHVGGGDASGGAAMGLVGGAGSTGEMPEITGVRDELLKVWYRRHLQAQCAGCDVCAEACSRTWGPAFMRDFMFEGALARADRAAGDFDLEAELEVTIDNSLPH